MLFVIITTKPTTGQRLHSHRDYNVYVYIRPNPKMKRIKQNCGVYKKYKISQNSVIEVRDENENELEQSVEKVEKKKVSYQQFFRYEFQNGEKCGVCLICEKKKIETKVAMKQSNTTGLKKHLLHHHLAAYESLFGRVEKPIFTQSLDKFVVVST